MDCERYQEALSARIDGEDPGIGPETLARHLSGCATCRAFATSAGVLDGRVGALATAPVPDRSADVLAAIVAERRAGEERRESLRVVLGAVGVAGVVVALPGLLVPDRMTDAHLLRELGAFDVALAVGFILAALHPVRALGLLPLVAALAVCLIGVAIADLAAGSTTLLAEAHHALELVGLVVLWRLARPLRSLTAVVA